MTTSYKIQAQKELKAQKKIEMNIIVEIYRQNKLQAYNGKFSYQYDSLASGRRRRSRADLHSAQRYGAAHRERLARPVTAGAQPLELTDDCAAAFGLPFPDFRGEFLPPQFGA